MKGVILAGGNATRLRPLTHVTNKHLLPVYQKPVIYYAIEKMVEAGIDRIMIVTAPQYVSQFVNLLGSGQDFVSKRTGKQIQIAYGVQNEPRGIAQALWVAKDYVGTEDVILHLGDNIIEDDISEAIQNFSGGATVFLKKVPDPHRYGVAVTNKKGDILEIIEKPENPKSDLAVVGAYIYDNGVFEKLVGQSPSARGEYEITYVNNRYLSEGRLRGIELTKPWFDVGTFESLHEASVYMRGKHRKQNEKA